MNRLRFVNFTLSLSIMLFSFIVFTSIAHADTLFYYTSSPLSYIGGGEAVTVTPSDGFVFDVSINPDQGVSFWIDDITNNPDFWLRRWWYLDFAGPLDESLQVGHYGNATRYPFQDFSEPGLQFGGNGRGNNELSGYFDVLEVNYDVSGNVLAFAADFMQYDEGDQDWWNYGSVRYNSTIPTTVVPEPISSTLFIVGGATLGYRRFRKKCRV